MPERIATFRKLVAEGLLEIGDGYRAKNEELGGSGHIFLRAGHVQDTHFDFAGVDRFHDHLAGRVASKLSQTGDTIVTTKGNSTGRAAYVGPTLPPFVYSPHLSYWRSRDHAALAPLFLRYWSRSPEFAAQLSGMKASTDMAPYLSLSDQLRLQVTVPEPRVQAGIGQVLGALDDKIELNRRMNDTLEAMARALFQSWFVDFDPVRAKAEGRAPSCMDAATAAVFPDGFEKSDLGEIPRGWVPTRLKELTSKVGSGATPSGGDRNYVDDGVAFIRSQNVYDSTFVWEGLARIDDASAEQLRGVTVQEADVLLNITGASMLRTCLVVPSVLPARVNQHVAIVRAKDAVPASFLHLHLLEPGTKSFLRGMDAGGSRQAVTKAHIESVPVVLPSAPVLARFKAVIEPLLSSKDNRLDESRTLLELRDALLPKLLAGEVSVRDAEKAVEEVA